MTAKSTTKTIAAIRSAHLSWGLNMSFIVSPFSYALTLPRPQEFLFPRRYRSRPALTGPEDVAEAAILVLQHDAPEGVALRRDGVKDAAGERAGARREGQRQPIAAKVGDAVVRAEGDLINDILR